MLWELKYGGATLSPAAGSTLHKAYVKLRNAELAPNTGDGYRRRLDQARVYARSTGIPESTLFPPGRTQGMPLPALRALLVWGAGRWRADTMDGLTAAISDWHRDKPHATNPLHTPEGALAVRGAKSLAKGNGRPPRGQAAALDTTMLAGLLAWLRHSAETRDPARAALYERDACWAVLGFFGLLRRAELGDLRVGDITTGAEGIEIRLRWTKTTGHDGATVWVANRTASGIDVAGTAHRWLHRRGGGNNDPLFTAWAHPRTTGNWGGIGYMTSRPLDAKGAALVEAFQRHLAGSYGAGFTATPPQGYSGHSLRRGGATAMRAAGCRPAEIMAHGRWTSDAYKRYLQRTDGERISVTAQL